MGRGMEPFRDNAFYLLLWRAILAGLIGLVSMATCRLGPAATALIGANVALLFSLGLMASLQWSAGRAHRVDEGLAHATGEPTAGWARRSAPGARLPAGSNAALRARRFGCRDRPIGVGAGARERLATLAPPTPRAMIRRHARSCSTRSSRRLRSTGAFDRAPAHRIAPAPRARQRTTYAIGGRSFGPKSLSLFDRIERIVGLGGPLPTVDNPDARLRRTHEHRELHRTSQNRN